jgi:hypothetical protein
LQSKPTRTPIDQTPEQRKAKFDDLKQTLNAGHGMQMVDNNLLTFHEKVDNIFDEHEQLQKNHLEYLKEAA